MSILQFKDCCAEYGLSNAAMKSIWTAFRGLSRKPLLSSEAVLALHLISRLARDSDALAPESLDPDLIELVQSYERKHAAQAPDSPAPVQPKLAPSKPIARQGEAKPRGRVRRWGRRGVTGSPCPEATWWTWRAVSLKWPLY